MSDVRYLIFDVETVGDGDLIRRVRYPDNDDMSDREAIEQYHADLLEQTGRDVLPATFVLPVSVAVGKVTADYRLTSLAVLDAPQFRPEQITRGFWKGWMHYDRPTLVTFNGRGYDLPVLEFGAFRYGISLPAWFNVESRAYEQSRNRYNIDRHIDLQDFFSNFSAVRVNGGLNLVANLIDKPGKSGVDGSQVQGLWWDGQVEKINDYCRCDVLDTYFVFLRSRVLIGRLSLEDEQTLIDDTRHMLEAEAEDHPAYVHYLTYWDKRLEQQQARAEAEKHPRESAEHEQSDVKEQTEKTVQTESDALVTDDSNMKPQAADSSVANGSTTSDDEASTSPSTT